MCRGGGAELGKVTFKSNVVRYTFFEQNTSTFRTCQVSGLNVLEQLVGLV